MDLEYNPNTNASELITRLRNQGLGNFPEQNNIPEHMSIYQYEQIAPPPVVFGIYRQMSIDSYMEARTYYDRLRMFNLTYGYISFNKDLPLPQNIPQGVLLIDYR
jgi:hypothetical protein